MAALVTVTPAELQEGDLAVITGTGFLPNVQCVLSIPEMGIVADIKSGPDGTVSSQALAAKAIQTLTSDTTIPTANDTVTLDSVTYTFKSAPTTVANEVKLGASAAEALTNLKAAINADPAGSGTLYGSATVVHPTIGAGALTATTLQVYAKTGGTAGNSLASTETSSHLSFGAATLAGGAAVAATTDPVDIYPTADVPFTAKISDGTTTASTFVRVSTQ